MPPSSDLHARRRWLLERARRAVGDRDLAEDLAQDALVVWLERSPSSERPLEPWMSVVLTNIERAWRRRFARRRARELAASLADEAVAADPESELVRLEARRRVALAVEGLRSPYRETVRALYWDAALAIELARAEGLPPSTVRRRHQIALSALREATS